MGLLGSGSWLGGALGPESSILVRCRLYEEEVGGVGIVLHVQLRRVQLLFRSVEYHACRAAQVPHRCRTGEHLGIRVKFDKLEAVGLVPQFISSRQDAQHIES